MLVFADASVASHVTVVVPAKYGSNCVLPSERLTKIKLELGQLSNNPPLLKSGWVTCTSEAQSPPLVLVASTWMGVMTGSTSSVMVTRNCLDCEPQTLDALMVTVVLPVGINLPNAKPVPVPLPLPRVAPLNK
jgi:hypothetical protein